MPKYRYALTNGKTMVLEGDTEPSDADVEAEAKSEGVSLVLNDQAPPEPTQAPVEAPAAAMPEQSPESPLPGMVAGAGMAIRAGKDMVRPAIQMGGKFVQSQLGQRAVGGLVGAGSFAAASAAGAPPVAAGGASLLGYGTGRKMARTVGKFAERAASKVPFVDLPPGAATRTMVGARGMMRGLPGLLGVLGSSMSQAGSEGEALSKFNTPEAMAELEAAMKPPVMPPVPRNPLLDEILRGRR